MLAYIDDLLGWELSLSRATEAFQQNRQLMGQLGLQESVEKVLQPAQVVNWRGVTFNSKNMTISIPQEKITAIPTEVKVWLEEQIIQLKEQQQLLV